MKINKLIIFALLLFNKLFAQNIGINTPNPTEILHVNGNLNVSNGAIKTNGTAGRPGNVLSMGSDGNMAWANPVNLGDFKYSKTIAGSYTNETMTTWTVPAGVTRILVEAWGGGEGGSVSGIGGGGHGGGGGGYSAGIIEVVPGQVADIVIGGGGLGRNTVQTLGNAGELGHYTRLTVNTSLIEARGGSGGGGYTSANGDFSCSNCLSFYYLMGQSGFDHVDRYEQISSTDFIKNKNFGNGGAAPYTYFNNGGIGEYSYINVATNVLTAMSYATDGSMPGGGGGGCSFYTNILICGDGGPGMVVIHY